MGQKSYIISDAGMFYAHLVCLGISLCLYTLLPFLMAPGEVKEKSEGKPVTMSKNHSGA